MTLAPPGDDWVYLGSATLPLGQLTQWAVLPRCGAVVVFAGTVRDHAEGRPGVMSLEYEAYERVAISRMRAVAAGLRAQWPSLGRVGLLHRTGLLRPTEISVAVGVSAPHREEAFEAARAGIDEIKSQVPIWKRETWEGGSEWGLDSHPLEGSRS